MSNKEVRKFQLHLTADEMHYLGNAVKGFYTVMNKDGADISPIQTMQIKSALEKFKHAMKHQAANPNAADIEVVENKIIIASH